MTETRKQMTPRAGAARMSRKAALVAVGAGLAAAALGTAPASAGVVSVSGDYNRVIEYTAAPGEQNDLHISGQIQEAETLGIPACSPHRPYCTTFRARLAGGAVAISDASAPVRAGAGCVSVNERTAVCAAVLAPYGGPGIFIRADLGDGDDSALLELPAAVNAGAGKDRIKGSSFPDYVNVQDGEEDTVDCAEGGDGAYADSIDALDGCESVSYPAGDSTATKPGNRKK